MIKNLFIFILVLSANLIYVTAQNFDKENKAYMTITDKQILKSKVINCSLDTAWWKWTTHEGLMTFFGKGNKIELIPGGAFEIYFNMESPEGSRGSEGCIVLSYLPKQMLSFSWNAPPNFKEVRESSYHTWVVVTFKQSGTNKTETTITHLGWPDDSRWDPVYDYFNNAWETVINRLSESCAK